MPIIPSIEINHRIDFPLLCNARGCRIAVEIGTDQGVFARQFMERFEGQSLLCVDPYGDYDCWLPGDRTPDMLMAINALQPYHGRVRIIKAQSPAIVERLPPWIRPNIDFVYIDGNHEYAPCKADILAWWQVVSERGMLAGHDYDATHPGVMQAVQEFADETGATVRIVEGDSEPSWYAYKQEPSTLRRRFWQGGEVGNEAK